jgi:hypothetical protein
LTNTAVLLPTADTSTRNDSAPRLTPDLLLGVEPILLFNSRGNRLHCFSSREQAVAFLRAAMRR